MSTRLWVAALIYPMVQAVMFGAGLLVALTLRGTAPLTVAIPVVILLTAALSAPIAWFIAPRMMLRYQQGYRPRPEAARIAQAQDATAVQTVRAARPLH